MTAEVLSTPPHPQDSHSPSRGFSTGVLLIVLAAFFFALNGTISKVVMQQAGINGLQLVQIRSVGAGIVFLAMALMLHRRQRSTTPWTLREAVLLSVLGILGVAMVQWLYFEAIARVPVSIALLLEFMAPLFIALYMRFIAHRPVHDRVWVALVLSLIGLGLIGGITEGGLTLDGLGVLAGLGAALALTAYYLMGEGALERRDSLTVAAWTFAVAGLFWLLVVPSWDFPWNNLGDPITLPLRGLDLDLPLGLMLAAVVLVGTVAPFGLVLLGLRRIGPARAGLLGTLEPVLAGVIAWLAIAEVLSPVQLVGCAIVLIGIVLAETSRGS